MDPKPRVERRPYQVRRRREAQRDRRPRRFRRPADRLARRRSARSAVSRCRSTRRASAPRRHERIMIVELSPRRAIDFSKSADPMRFTNHSCRPNARLCIDYGRVEFYALRDIAAGEEITVDYGETHHAGRLACRCGAAGCRGAL
ncbi:MAG: SET domain-containing protein-lysine N-methyltransferase [Comamonadaceae bacterium]|nr:SET domain-containing protein-lysine N-methyltransferase [Comamonadaceae bacterium]